MIRFRVRPAVAFLAVGGIVLVALVVFAALGVSVPASANDKDSHRIEREERDRRRRMRENVGERGHVRRRSHVPRNGSRVEKKPGWRRVE